MTDRIAWRCLTLGVPVWVALVGALAVHAQSDPFDRVARFGEGTTTAVQGAGFHVFMANGRYLDAYDTADPEAPVRLGRLELTSRAHRMVRDGDRVYALLEGGGFQIVDVATPAAMVALGRFEGALVEGIAVQNGFAYLAMYNQGLGVVDLSDPGAPVLVGQHTTSGQGYTRDVAVWGDYAFLANWVTFQVLDIRTPSTPVPVRVLSTGASGLDTDFALGVSVHDGVVYLSGWDALVSLQVSDPANPVVADRVVWPPTFTPRTQVLEGDRLYVQSHRELATLEAGAAGNLELLAIVDSTPGGGGGQVAVGAGRLYVAELRAGVRVYDPSSSGDLVQLGRVENGGVIADVAVHGGRAYVVGSRFRVVDVTVPEAAREVWRAPVVGYEVVVGDGRAYVVGEGMLFIYDLADPDAPQLVGSYDPPLDGLGYIAVHGPYVFAHMRYEGDNFVVLDAADPAAITVRGRAILPCFPVGPTTATATTVFVACGGILPVAYDWRDPDHLALLTVPENTVSGNVADDTYWYAANTDGLFTVYATDAPGRIDPVGSTASVVFPERLRAADGFVYGLCGESGAACFVRFDVSDPAAPFFDATQPLAMEAQVLDAEGRVVVVGSENEGFDVYATPGTVAVAPDPPGAAALALAGPNPFAGATTLRYTLRQSGPVHLAVFDLLGRRLAVLAGGTHPAGTHTVRLDAAGMADGVYLVRLQTEADTATLRVLHRAGGGR